MVPYYLGGVEAVEILVCPAGDRDALMFVSGDAVSIIEGGKLRRLV